MTNKWIAVFGIGLLALLLAGCSRSAVKPLSVEGGEIHLDRAVESDMPSMPEADPSIAALVNKRNCLDEAYVPDDLVAVDVPTVLNNPEVNQLRREAAGALKEMFHKAAESGIELYARSGYRSYKTQKQLFENYVAKHGEEAANRYSARAGQSEHQTGLVMDVTSESVHLKLDEAFGETAEGEWVSAHGHEFGFIVRYPKGQEKITGYMYEPWHIRYLGKELAAKVFESGLAYEDYLEMENQYETNG